MTIPEDRATCYSPTNPTDGPSGFVSVPLTADQRWADRGMVLFVGTLGVVLITGLGLRLASGKED